MNRDKLKEANAALFAAAEVANNATSDLTGMTALVRLDEDAVVIMWVSTELVADIFMRDAR